jgi:hypothetical protein
MTPEQFQEAMKQIDALIGQMTEEQYDLLLTHVIGE